MRHDAAILPSLQTAGVMNLLKHHHPSIVNIAWPLHIDNGISLVLCIAINISSVSRKAAMVHDTIKMATTSELLPCLPVGTGYFH